jgi:hypothetical protein
LSVLALLFAGLAVRDASHQTKSPAQALTASLRPLVVGVAPRSVAEQDAIDRGTPVRGAPLQRPRARDCVKGQTVCVFPENRVSVPIRNVGRGVALIETAQLTRPFARLPLNPADAIEAAPLIPAGAVQRFDFVSSAPNFAVEIRYTDVAGQQRQTSCTYVRNLGVDRIVLGPCVGRSTLLWPP